VNYFYQTTVYDKSEYMIMSFAIVVRIG